MNLSSVREAIGRRGFIVAAYLFGSRLTGTARPDSDLDVAVLLRDTAPRGLALGVVLVPIPVLRWSSISPVLMLAKTDDPFQAVKVQQALRSAEETRRKRDFLENALTPAERELLERLVSEQLSNKELAARLRRSPHTVANQLTSIYEKFRSYFGVADADRSVLIGVLTPLLSEERLG